MKTTKLIIALTSLLIVTSCSKECFETSAPHCIEETIKTEKNQSLKKVYEYTYQGKSIYKLIYSGDKNTNENSLGIFVDEDCNILCDQLSNLIVTPKGTDPCTSIELEANYKKLVWEKFEFDFEC